MRKNLAYLFLLIILAGLAFFFVNKDKGRNLNTEVFTEFAIEDTSQVHKIFISNNVTNENIVLTRNANDRWLVNNTYTAKKDRIDIILKSFARAEVIYPVPKTEMESVIKLMASNNRKIMIYGADEKLIKTWYLSHGIQSQQGTYALLEYPDKGRSAEPSILSLSGFRGFLTNRFNTDLLDWRSTSVFSFPDLNIKEIEVFRPRELHNSFKIKVKDYPTQQFALEDNDGNAILFSPKTLAQYISGFKNINLESYRNNMENSEIDSLRALQPDLLITVWNDQDEPKSVKLYYRPVSEDHKKAGYEYDPERMAGIVEDEIVSFQRNTVDKLIIKPNAFQF